RRVQCDLCPRYCKLQEGQRGFCFVRRARAGGIDLTSYGKASGFCVDPIEKKPLNHFYPGTSVLSFGTAGCNLGCRFCQNWDISKAREIDKLTDSASPERVAQGAAAAGCKSIAFTYNDPVIFAEYASDCAEAAHARGLKAVAVTAGYITETARESFFRHIDATNVDLKAFSEGFYGSQCFAKLAPVLDTLEWLVREKRVWLEVTTLLIPGKNDSDEELGQLTEWFADKLGPDVPLHFTAFHPDFKLLDIPSTPKSTLVRARDRGRAAGLRYVYTGNLRDAAGHTTFCPTCEAALIARDAYTVTRFTLRDAACPHCGTRIPGHFDAKAGNFGTRRIPVQLSTPKLL
ncbi:MAG TPA: AmmeMemoRadiSam system radical SAM enzyme, partial [Polyangiales bacterium]|nr:AmmeMemoRadiSam system radical SAM enzyme [Polyangiales bacterium]